MAKESLRARLTAEVWERGASKYTGATLLVTLKIAGLTRDEKGYADPSVAFLAKSCGITPRQVQRIITQLRKDGLLKVQKSKGRNGVNRYHLQLEALEKLELVHDRRADAGADNAQPALNEEELAKQFAKGLVDGMKTRGIDVKLPTGWEATWTASMRELVAKRVDKDTFRAVGRFALTHDKWKTLLAENGAAAFCHFFEAMKTEMQAQGKEQQ